MRVISFKNTVLLKRGVWLSAAAMMAYAAMPSLLDGELWQRPAVGLLPLCILGGFWGYALNRTMFFRMADEVLDGGDHLRIRKGRAEELLAFTDLISADVSTFWRMRWITLKLRTPTRLGDRIAFLPQASLWGNPAAIQQVATQLTARARPVGGVDGGV